MVRNDQQAASVRLRHIVRQQHVSHVKVVVARHRIYASSVQRSVACDAARRGACMRHYFMNRKEKIGQ